MRGTHHLLAIFVQNARFHQEYRYLLFQPHMPYGILSKMHGQLRLQHLSANHRYQTHESSMSQRPINTLSLLDLLYSVLAYVQQKRMRHTLTHSYYSFHLASNDYNLV